MSEWIQQMAEGGGYLVFFLLMLAQDLFPPLPSELIMGLAGFSASQGQIHLIGAVMACAAGSVLGMVFWYYIGKWIGLDRLKAWSARHGRWLTLTPGELDRMQQVFDRHGLWVVSFGRALPGIGVFIAVPAGMARMNMTVFLLAATAFNLVYCGLIVGAAAWLGEQSFSRMESWIGPLSTVVLAGCAVWYGWRVITFDAKR